MIPYFEPKPFLLFNTFTIHLVGLLIFCAIICGVIVSYLDAYKRKLDISFMSLLQTTSIAIGFFGSHAFVVLIYYPQEFLNNPMSIFQIYSSLSTYGGLVFGLATALIILKVKKYPMWPYIDNLVLAFSIAWLFGRLGCSFAHDHPGKLTNFFLGVKYPDGVRHDLGLYEFLYTILIDIVLIYIYRKNPKPGTLAIACIFLYMPVRFFLDFLRIKDVLYAGLTPGQYFSAAFFFLGIYLWRRQSTQTKLQTSIA